ncbi:MAG: sulfite exporter TauE/SafE family protein, partial [Terriglobales bacterium]
MSALPFTFYLLIGSTAAGLVGALTGLGGGVLLVPMLVLLFHVDVHYAVGASLISVIATSSGASAAYIREGYTNLRIATFLLVATVGGALLGAILAGHLHGRMIAIIFGGVLIFSAFGSMSRPEAPGNGRPSSPLALRLGMEGSLPTVEGPQPYRVYNLTGGFSLMLVAGALSGLLGIGSGAVKVLAMDQVMR